MVYRITNESNCGSTMHKTTNCQSICNKTVFLLASLAFYDTLNPLRHAYNCLSEDFLPQTSFMAC